MIRRVLRALLLCLAILLGASAYAHEMTITELKMQEFAKGEFIWSWGSPAKSKPVGDDLKATWPVGCKEEAKVLRCSAQSLPGSFAIKGLGDAYSAVVLRITYLGGQERVYTLSASQPQVRLMGSAAYERGAAEIASAYVLLGVEHILSGIDHLFFVISLLFLVGFRKQLVWTITAFTAAHSITLALSALGWLALRPAPVEATIALSIVLVCVEVLRPRQSMSKRWPSLVAFGFGLVHGLGFAGALKEIGLPDNYFFLSLLGFNLGVELGQLLVLAIAWLVYVAVRGRAFAAPSRKAVIYAIGCVAAYWSILRTVAIFS